MQTQEGNDLIDYPKCYVAFLDILGFSAYVKANSHEALKSIYEKFGNNIQHALSGGYVEFNDGENECIGPDIRRAYVNSLFVSDSILVWTVDESAESFEKIVKAVRSLLAFSILDGILLRGAIALGPLTMIVNQWPSQTHNFQCSMFGEPIVDAVNAEEKQEWCGCEITNEAIENYLKKASPQQSVIEAKMILSYPIPKKAAKFTQGYVIDWVNHPQAGIDANVVRGAFAPSPRTNMTDEDWNKIEEKMNNTLKFVADVKSPGSQFI